ncbi:abscission/NoCut checkpoint regulator [Aricia agestis]|uniref:abscission/NoCut checkpoint regulator n=1 Tax=Aricia agestis TaxID=91739 RepID=UPI001C202C91|nr:abscission/NoCut checkpoint regulator [Aricia agestis]
MSCNTCAKSFSILRQEKGCPGCGFSYCSKCLSYKIFLKKINSEAKVCVKCKRKAEEGETSTVTPPDAYYKRVGALDSDFNTKDKSLDPQDQQILERLQKLKAKPPIPTSTVTVGDIESRLQKLKGDVPVVSDSELQERLANIKGLPVTALQSKPVVLTTDKRTEQEQIDDLLKRYSEQANIDSKYTEEFDGVITDIEFRLQKLKGASTSGTQQEPTPTAKEDSDLEDDEAYAKKIIEKLKSEALAEKEDEDFTVKELPFCELCNEDAKMRCRGCKYLFCKVCFMEHRDDDDGCNSYDLYTPS